MTVDDALRRIRLLKMVKTENGFSENESETALRMTETLLREHAVEPEAVLPSPPPMHRPSWVYWQNLLSEYGLNLRRFGKRGSATIASNQHVILIRVDTGEWQVQKMGPGGWQVVLRDVGLDSMRAYLSKNAPRAFTFYQARR
jgi:hypothetical protein